MSASEDKNRIPLGLFIFIMIGDLPFTLGFFGHQTHTYIDYVFGALPLVLAVLMYRHSLIARAATVVLCLFSGMILGFDLPVAQSHSESSLLFRFSLGYAFVALLLWLAWLFSLSRSAREWFPKPTPAAG